MAAACSAGKFTARFGLFALLQFVREQFSEFFRRNLATCLDINNVRRKTAELVPRHHVLRGIRHTIPACRPDKTSRATKPKLTRWP